jgi:hypothetical protein
MASQGRFGYISCLKEKSEVFRTWESLLENQTGNKFKRLRTDNGLEFCNREFDNFCKAEGILSICIDSNSFPSFSTSLIFIIERRGTFDQAKER